MDSLTWNLLAIPACIAVLVGLRYALWFAFRALRAIWHRGSGLVGRIARWLQAHPFSEWFEQRFPRTSEFIRRRLDPATFTGLPLTLIFGAGVYIVFLFSGLAEEVLESDEIRVVDETVFALVDPLRSERWVSFFHWITELGSMPTLTAVAIVASAFMLAHGPRRYILPVWISVIGANLTTYAGKYIFDRPRPEFLFDITAATPSFPSGHTTGAMAVYGIIAYALLRDVRAARTRFDIAYWAGVVIALVGFSRIFLGVHFASDVAAGLLVGVFWLLVGIAVAEVRRVTPEST